MPWPSDHQVLCGRTIKPDPDSADVANSAAALAPVHIKREKGAQSGGKDIPVADNSGSGSERQEQRAVAADLAEGAASQLDTAGGELRAHTASVEGKMVAVARNDNALPHASVELWADREMVQVAVAQNVNALQQASAEVKGNRDVVLAAAAQNDRALNQASVDMWGLWGSRDVVLTALAQNGGALKYASAELKGDHNQLEDASEVMRKELKVEQLKTEELRRWYRDHRNCDETALNAELTIQLAHDLLKSEGWRVEVALHKLKDAAAALGSADTAAAAEEKHSASVSDWFEAGPAALVSAEVASTAPMSVWTSGERGDMMVGIGSTAMVAAASRLHENAALAHATAEGRGRLDEALARREGSSAAAQHLKHAYAVSRLVDLRANIRQMRGGQYPDRHDDPEAPRRHDGRRDGQRVGETGWRNRTLNPKPKTLKQRVGDRSPELHRFAGSRREPSGHDHHKRSGHDAAGRMNGRDWGMRPSGHARSHGTTRRSHDDRGHPLTRRTRPVPVSRGDSFRPRR
jgi:hypothetical protein